MQIAIDTSTNFASLALVEDDAILAEMTWRCGQDHSTQLLPSLSHLLKQTKKSLQEADCIIVAKGPGSYNGLRVGVGTAKGLAFSLGIPIVGISTLEVEAYQHAGSGLPVCAVLNASRGEIAIAIFQNKNNRWQQIIEEQITKVEMLDSLVEGKTIFCGEYMTTIADEVKRKLGEKAVFVSAAGNLRRAGFLAELGLKRNKAGDYDDPATLQPLYLRGPAITKPKHPKTEEGKEYGNLA